MKSRIAVLALLVSGMLFSTAGAGLALQGGGTAGSGTNAAVSQYATPTPTPTPTPEAGVLPAEEEKAPAPAPTEAGGGVLPAAAVQAQPARQQAAAAQGGQLPFTGFAAIPILLGGLALLTGGLVLRRRTRDH